MKRLIYIEWIKISRNRVFWITLAAYVVTIILVLLGMRSAINSINSNVSEVTNGMTVLPNEIFRFPHIWHNLAYIAKYIKIFIGILMILLVTNEIYYNTLRQNLINGMTRMEFVWSKFIDGVLLALFSTVILFAFGLLAGFINTNEIEFDKIFSKIIFLPGYFLMVVGYLTFIMMLSILLRKAILTMGIVLVYGYIIEPILSWKFSDSFGSYLPIQAFNGLILAPKTKLFSIFHMKTSSNSIDMTNIVLTLVYTAIFFAISYYVLKKRDL